MPVAIPQKFNLAEHFLDRPAGAHPERVAILGEGRPFSYGQLRQMANRVGDALRRGNCRPGERVLLVLPDCAEFMAAFFGATKVGAVAVPVNPMTRAADYAYYLADCRARLAIVHAIALAEFRTAAEGKPLDAVVVVGADKAENQMLRWEDWLASASDQLEPHSTAATDTAFLLYTSGSGGTPKGAVHQHKDMLVTSESFAQGVLGLRSEDRTFSVSKLFFAYGLGNGMYFPFSVGASTILNPERPKPDRVLELVARHRPTVFFAVPTFYAAILRAADEGAAADFSSVRLAVSAGEALPAEICDQFRRRFGLEILDGIGSTEMLHMFIASRPGKARPGSCGVEVPNYDAVIVDEQGQAVPTGEIGNLCVRGQSAFAGYWNKPELTARAKRDDWVITGDKFFRDREGYYYYCGRADDMMKVAGMWVSPGEVENALLGHPQVAEAAVVAHTELGLTKPVAYVVLRDSGQAGPQLVSELQEFVRQRLPSYKVPQAVHFLPELPKTATGKIQRFKLRSAAG